jgi:homoserine kinase type II
LHAREPSRFEPGELAVVLSHFDLGVIESVTDFPRGSRRSPKAGIVCHRGKFLLKRRPVARAPIERIRFNHLVQRRLIDAGFPAPKILPTRSKQEWLQVRDHVYELFEFLSGEPYRKSIEETRDAGATLGRFHQLAASMSDLTDAAPRGDFHDAPGIRTGLCNIGSTLSSHDSFTGDEAELQGLVQYLLAAYDRAADVVNQGGYPACPAHLVHADWHPGNLVFRKQAVLGVIDYDAMRISRRMTDIGNGALQFSIVASGDPAAWPAEADEERFVAFLDGYASHVPLTGPDRACIPALMIEALIAECVAPITQTGSVGLWSGFRVMQMAARKAQWLELHADRLLSVLRTPADHA